MKKKWWVILLLVCGLVGLADASYLTWEHFRDVPPPCEITWVSRVLGNWVDCGRVLNSKWAMVGSIPTSMLGMMFYAGVLGWAGIELLRFKIDDLRLTICNKEVSELLSSKWWYRLLILMAVAGVMTSTVLVYLMIGVIGSVCLYCLLSAVNTVVIGVGTWGVIRGIGNQRP